MNELRQDYLITEKNPEVRIHFVETNRRPHNPLVLFVHDCIEYWRSWHSYLHAMAREGMHGVAIDLRGFNESTRPEKEEAYRLDHLVHDLEKVIDHFGPKSTFLVGHGLGGIMAHYLAVKRPNLLSGMVIINAVALSPARLEHDFFTEAHKLKFLTSSESEAYKKALDIPGVRKSAAAIHAMNKKLWNEVSLATTEVPTLLLSSGKGGSLEGGHSARFYPRASHWIHLERPVELQNEMIYFFALNRLQGRHSCGSSERPFNLLRLF